MAQVDHHFDFTISEREDPNNETFFTGGGSARHTARSCCDGCGGRSIGDPIVESLRTDPQYFDTDLYGRKTWLLLYHRKIQRPRDGPGGDDEFHQGHSGLLEQSGASTGDD